jgi:hypothetical protein
MKTAAPNGRLVVGPPGLEANISAALVAWTRRYLREASQDLYAKDGSRASRVKNARRAVDTTITLVRETAFLLALDGRKPEHILRFVRKQVYDVRASSSRYLLEFVDFDLSRCWLLVDDLDEVDLEDIVGAAEFSRRSIEHFEVGRANGKPLTKRELATLARKVRDDHCFDDASGQPLEIVREQRLLVYFGR